MMAFQGETQRTMREDPAATSNDMQLVAALRRGDEKAFEQLLERYHNALIRVAMAYVSRSVIAEEVVQEVWLSVLQNLDKFEGRSSLKTWIFRILINRAKSRGVRESRSIPFSALRSRDDGSSEPSVDADRFDPANHEWLVAPQSWETVPEEHFLAGETRSYIQRAIDALPPNQRTVITLRDVDGWSSEEVCRLLNISEANQRVLLHRARSGVRRSLEQYFAMAPAD